MSDSTFFSYHLPDNAFSVVCPDVTKDETLLLLPDSIAPNALSVPAPIMHKYGALAPLAAGRVLYDNKGPCFRITSRVMNVGTPHAIPACLLQALNNHEKGPLSLTPARQGISVAFVTLSDKGSCGLREDESGPAIAKALSAALPVDFTAGFILPDSPQRLQALITDLAHHQGYDIIITTGGTGLGPRDTTPEALLPILSRRLPGFEQCMMQASLQKTPSAAISRAIAGSVGLSLLLCLPGSKKAVLENLEAITPALQHALGKLQGDAADCGR